MKIHPKTKKILKVLIKNYNCTEENRHNKKIIKTPDGRGMYTLHLGHGDEKSVKPINDFGEKYFGKNFMKV